MVLIYNVLAFLAAWYFYIMPKVTFFDFQRLYFPDRTAKNTSSLRCVLGAMIVIANIMAARLN